MPFSEGLTHQPYYSWQHVQKSLVVGKKQAESPLKGGRRGAGCTANRALRCCLLLSRAETPRQHPRVLQKPLLSEGRLCLQGSWGTRAGRTSQTRLYWQLTYDERPPPALSLASQLASSFFYSVGKGKEDWEMNSSTSQSSLLLLFFPQRSSPISPGRWTLQ